MSVRAVCVYCGSSTGNDERYGEAARSLGRALAAADITVVYGGGSVGLMGLLAQATMDAGGRVVGVIPTTMFHSEVAMRQVTEFIEVPSMHERKMRMFEYSDAFVALPGGLGTFEELTEVSTWAQLGHHDKPIITVDIAGYWSSFHEMLRRAVAEGFMKAKNLELITNVSSVDEVLSVLGALP